MKLESSSKVGICIVERFMNLLRFLKSAQHLMDPSFLYVITIAEHQSVGSKIGRIMSFSIIRCNSCFRRGRTLGGTRHAGTETGTAPFSMYPVFNSPSCSKTTLSLSRILLTLLPPANSLIEANSAVIPNFRHKAYINRGIVRELEFDSITQKAS